MSTARSLRCLKHFRYLKHFLQVSLLTLLLCASHPALAVAPTLTAIASNPSSAITGTSVTLTLTGTGFSTTPANNTITFGSATLTTATATATTLTATLTLPAAGSYPVTVTNGGGTSNDVTFTVNPVLPTPPTLSTVTSNPSSAITGTSVTLTLTGTGFSTTPANNTITFGSATLTTATATATTLTATLTLPAAGSYTVTVTNGNGTSNSFTFTVNPVLPTPPTLSTVTSNPVAAITGTSVTLTLTGTGFSTTPANNTITFGSATLTTATATATTLTATLTLPAAGSYPVTVTTSNGASNAVTFTVNPAPPPAPTLTAIASNPVAAITGTSVTLTLTGTGFNTVAAANNSVKFNGTQLATGATVNGGGTSLTATLTLPAAGSYTVTVTNGNGTSNAVAFTVNPVPAPTLTSVTPLSGTTGATNFTLTFAGTGFDAGTVANNVVNFNGSPLGTQTAQNTTTTTSLVVNVTLPAAGTYPVTVTNGSGTSNAVTFTVNPVLPPAPTLTAVTSTPSAAITGTSVTLTLTGTGFTTGSANTVTLTPPSGSPLTFGNAPATSATSLSLAGILPAPNTYTVKVTNVNGTTTPGVLFVVNPGAPPTLTSVTSSPASAITGTSVTLTLIGAGFLNGANTVILTGTTGGNAGVITSFGTTGSTDGTTLTLTGTLPIPADTYAVTVTNANGTTSSVPFTVNPVPVPTLTAVTSNPAAAITGTSVTLTLTGTHFTTSGNNTVIFTRAGVQTTFSNATASGGGPFATTLTASGTLPAAGNYTVTVTTQYGTTSPGVAFTVNNPTPVLSSLSPNSGSPNTVVDLTINGTSSSGTGFVVPTVPATPATGSVPNFSFTPTGGGPSSPITPTSFTVNNATQISVTGLALPATSGTISVTVTNPNPGATTSAPALTFTVNAPPTLTSVSSSPTSAVAGTSVTLTLTGTNFTTSTVNTVTFTLGAGAPYTFGSATATSATSLTVSGILPPTAGSYTVSVSNINGSAPSGVPFTVFNPTPSIINIDPKSANAGSTVATLNITGTGFVSGSTANFNFSPADGSPASVLTITSSVDISKQQITVSSLTLPAVPGTITITVINPATNVGVSTSNSALFQVSTIAPTVNSISSNPASATAGAQVTLTLLGTNYLFSASGQPNTVTFLGTDSSGAPTTFTFGSASATNSTGNTLNVTGALPPTSGTYGVTVSNINGQSTPVSFTISNPPAKLTGLFQADGVTPYQGDLINKQNVTIVIKGTGFVLPQNPADQTTGSVPTLNFNGGSITTFTSTVTDPQTITLSGLTLPATAGTLFISVTNPPPGGGITATTPFTVFYPAPGPVSSVLDSNGNTSDAAGTAVDLVVTGPNFVQASTVTILSTDGTTNLTPAGTVTPILDAQRVIIGLRVPGLTLPAAPGNITVTVVNPNVNSLGGGSVSAPFQVTPAPITLTPTSAFVGDPAVNELTISTNAAFLSNPSVTFGTTPLTLSPTSTPNSLVALLPAEDFNAVQEYPVTVHQNDGSTSTKTFSALPLGPLQTPLTGSLATEYFSAPQQSGKDGLLLFSVPYDYSGDTIDPVIGSVDLEDIDPITLSATAQPARNFAVWDPANSIYDVTNATGYDPTKPQTPGKFANALALGRGYWGRFPAASTTSIVGLVKRGTNARALSPGTFPIDAKGSFQILLQQGWNMIGDPWAETEGLAPAGVLLQNIQVSGNDSGNLAFTGSLAQADTAGLVSAVFYSYDASTVKYTPISIGGADPSIKPYIGYWVYAYRDCTLLIPQP